MFKRTLHTILSLAAGLLLAEAQCLAQTAAQQAPDLIAVFTVQAAGKHAIVRVLTHAASCPDIVWEAKYAQPMSPRATPASTAARGEATQGDGKPAVFDVLSCEAHWPVGVSAARVGAINVPAPRAAVRRIVLIADTGCRMKGVDKAFQPCSDTTLWPFAEVAKHAAATRPDLVVHIGDIHYRESPCPEANTGCANSPWGYGFDAWQADFFEPATPLLGAAPWVFVRGNHESCARAGQGWFRFIDTQPWRQDRSCDDPAHDSDADYSPPYAVPLDARAQFIVFDSSKSGAKPLAASDPAFARYTDALNTVAQLSKAKPESIFLSHHPLLAVAPGKAAEGFKPAGNPALQSVFATAYPQRFFPDGVSMALHGHVHMFEAISFQSAHPATFVVGNTASANEGHVPASLPGATELYPGAVVQDYMARAEFGFATLDRLRGKAAGRWLLTEYTVQGRPVMRCTIAGGKSRCSKL